MLVDLFANPKANFMRRRLLRCPFAYVEYFLAISGLFGSYVTAGSTFMDAALNPVLRRFVGFFLV